jgi:hypothetical protein
LHEAGAAKVFKEKISGAASNRAQLHRLLKTTDAGPLWPPGWIGWPDQRAQRPRQITKAGATSRSLGDAWAETTTAHGRLMLTVLGGLAEFERKLSRVRTGEGSRSREGERRPYGASLQVEPASATRSDCATRCG